MGSSYNSPSPQPAADVLRDYTKWLPSLVGATGSSLPGLAQNQFNSTLATQPLYNALNLQQAQNYSVPLAEVGQNVQRSNALAGGETNRQSITGAGGASALAAGDLARTSNPNYYNVQDATSKKAVDLMDSINLKGLTGGEASTVERGVNQGMQGTGNLGLRNNTNTIANAINFGGAFNNKLGILSNALNSANQTATSAQNTGFNPVNIALGQPNASTMGNFGTGTFTNTNAGTQNATAGNAFNFGSSVLGGQTSMNNAATGGAYGLAQANSVPAYMNATGSILGGL